MARSESDRIDAVRERLEASVAMQMVSDVPIGAFLSGGIDSSAVVGFMARHTGQAVKTYAIGRRRGGGGDYDELPPCAPHRGALRNRAPRDRSQAGRCGPVAEVLWHMDEPVADTAFVTTYLVSSSRAARSR